MLSPLAPSQPSCQPRPSLDALTQSAALASPVKPAEERAADRASALGRLFDHHHYGLLNTATRLLGCRKRAEDVVQEAFLKVWERRDSQAVVEPSRYLYRVVQNLAVDQLRRKKLEERWFVSPDEQDEGVASDHSAERVVQAREEIGLVVRALRQLPARTQDVITLCRVEGLTQRDVARRIGASPALVNFLLQDATLHCRNSLTGSCAARNCPTRGRA
ncbi:MULTISPECIES: sigma-70 family RNA polymerase sigma factor [Pseudomonas]|uniref:sigma-70 family RNA polymerase sigma factor n=1 Tax=Pseudomonas TaxID=286 RepID=UPI0009E796A4|nr:MULTISPECIES: sigma-70 family RNA polymerase sigma factor [Pseudomonas]WCE09924.1 sigma-70 family RNA polymerase sigma factor [Pseudomonas sp. JBR1]